MLHAGARGHRARPARATAAGCSTRRCNVASIFIPDGTIVSTRRAQRSRGRSTWPRATRSRPRSRWSCSSTAARPRRPRSSPARCRIAARAKVVGTHTFGKGVFQEIEPLSNGGALGLHRRPVLHAQRPEPRRRRRARGAGIQPNIYACTKPDAPRRRRADGGRADRRGRGSRGDAAARARAAHPRSGARVGVAACASGQFLVAEPFFERGAAARSSAATSAPAWATSCCRAAGTAPGAAGAPGRAWSAALGRPDVARDVIEALMLDRGLRARLRSGGGARGARGRRRQARRRCPGASGATCASSPRSRSTRRPRATSTTPSRPSELGDGRWRVWVHIADVAAYVRAALAASTARPTAAGRACTSPGRSSRCCPSALSNDACSLVPGRGPARGDGRDGAARAREVRAAAFYRSRDPLGRAARLRPRRPRSSPAASGAASRGAGPLGRARARPRRCARGARAPRARRARGRLGRARVRLRPRRQRRRRRGRRSRPSPTG